MSGLDGLTLLRYGHTYDSGGGIEQYLTDLNGVLHQRSRFRTIQVQLTSDRTRIGESNSGDLTRVSLFVEQSSHERAVVGTNPPAGIGFKLKRWLRDHVVFAPGIYPWLTRPRLARRRLPRRDGEPDDAGRTVQGLLRRFPVDLICLHSAGSADVAEVLAAARAEGIPAVYVHHFANHRLADLSVRYQLEQMAGIAGVCPTEVPRFIAKRFCNVADGIDTTFFRRDHPELKLRRPERPVIFLPARITPTKGQADLIRAAGALKRKGLTFQVVLAGRIDSPAFYSELQQLIAREQLADEIVFVGQLGPAELRSWYAAAAIVAFPTRHHEGLPRILLECQAMETPPVVHDIGGTSSGMRDQSTGFLIGVGDFSALVDRLEILLRDEPKRQAMGRAGRELVEAQFSLPALAQRHEQFYLQALARGKKSGPSASPGGVR